MLFEKQKSDEKLPQRKPKCHLMLYFMWTLDNKIIDNKYVHTDTITDFRILVIPQAISEVRAFKLDTGAPKALNKLIDGFCDNRKILFCTLSGGSTFRSKLSKMED